MPLTSSHFSIGRGRWFFTRDAIGLHLGWVWRGNRCIRLQFSPSNSGQARILGALQAQLLWRQICPYGEGSNIAAAN
jgi:hypothetical protein